MIKNGRGVRFPGIWSAGLALALGCRAAADPALAQGREAQGPGQAPEFQGVIEFEEVQLGFEFPGRLHDVWVRRGDRVQAGERIAAIDDSLEQAATRARRSESEAAQARAALTQAGSRPEEVRALEARLRAADANIRQLSDNWKRDTQLLAQGAAPPARVDDLRAQLDHAQAERDALAQNLALAKSGARREEIAAQRSQAEASVALLEAQQRRESRYEISAPISGDVLDHHHEPGEVVGAGVPIVTLADTSRPYAEVFVPQAELSLVTRGAPAHVRVDARAESLPAHVESIARRVEFTPRYLFSERERPNLVVRVRVRIDDPQHLLQAGVPARVTFDPAGAAHGS